MGARFEFKVAEFVRRYIPDTYCYMANAIVTRRYTQPSTPPEIDLLVVGPNGIFIIEAKSGMDRVTGDFFGPWTRIRYGRGGVQQPDTPIEPSPGDQLKRKLQTISSHLSTLPNEAQAHLWTCCIAVFPENTRVDISFDKPNPPNLHYHAVNLGPELEPLLLTWQSDQRRRLMTSEEADSVLAKFTPAQPVVVEAPRNYTIEYRGPVQMAANGLPYRVCVLRQTDVNKRRRGKWYDIASLGQDDRDRFEAQVSRHATVLAKLDGFRHVQRFIDFFASYDTLAYWVIEEWLDVEPLQAILDANRETDLPTADTMRTIAQALNRIHTLRPHHVHRSLNPEAVLVERSTKRALVGNFELTRIDGERTVAAGTVPTDPYCAPEVLSDPHSAKPQCDLYSWAAICFRLTTGTLPTEHYQDSLARLQATALPAATSQVVAECLRTVPSQRPRSIDVVLHRIRDWR